MKYKLSHHRWGPYYRKLREDHVELLYEIYKSHGLEFFRTDDSVLPKDRSKRNYFLERMNWTFKFIDAYRPSEKEKENYRPHEKQMVHYKLNPKGLKILIQCDYKIKDKDVALVTKEVLYNDL